MSQENDVFNFGKLKEKARNEEWDAVDQNLSQFVNDDTAIQWVREEGLFSDNPHLRDLAASIFQGSSVELTEEDRDALEVMMRTDSNIYAQFRAAFALFTHNQRNGEVLAKVREAQNDPDVKEIAERYLKEFNNTVK